MEEVSKEQVETAINSIEASQDSLNGEVLTNKTNTLNDIINILDECWNTTSGKAKQKRLKEIMDIGFLDFMKISNAFYKTKEATITYTTTSQTKTYR